MTGSNNDPVFTADWKGHVDSELDRHRDGLHDIRDKHLHPMVMKTELLGKRVEALENQPFEIFDKWAWRSHILFILLAFLVLTTLILILYQPGLVHAQTTDSEAARALIVAYQEKVDLLKWIGGIMVTALSATVALLYRANIHCQKIIIEQVKGIAKIREQAYSVLGDLSASVKVLIEKVDRLVGVEK